MYATWKHEVGDPLLPKKWPPRIRVGINGYGSVARLLIRCACEDRRGIEIVAINAPQVTPEELLYMIKYDTKYGPFKGVISQDVVMHNSNYCGSPACLFIEICGRRIAYFNENNTAKIPWDWLNVEYVIETLPEVQSLAQAEQHLMGGRARKVIVVGDTVDIPIMFYPVSYKSYQRGTSIIATGSANALALGTILYLLDNEFEIVNASATIISSYTDDFSIIDSHNIKGRRHGRSCTQSIIPHRLDSVINTIEQALPSIKHKVNLTAFTIPVASGTVVDITCEFEKSFESIKELIHNLQFGVCLKRLEDMHCKCQPGWLMQRWCPESCESDKSKLPKIECVSEIDCPPIKHRMLLGYETSVDSEQKNHQNGAEATSKTVLEQKPIAPCFFKEQAAILPTPVAEFWTGDQLGVSTDVLAADSMMVVDTQSSITLPGGKLHKIIIWFDKDMSFCKRIIDTLVFMRHVDHS